MTETVPDVFVPPPEPLPEVVTQLLMFGTALESARRRKGSRRLMDADTTSDQLALF